MVLLRFVSLSHRIILSICIEFLSAFVGKKRGVPFSWSSFFFCARRNVSCRSYTRSSPRRAMIAPRPFWRSTPRIPGTFLPSPRRCVVVFVASTCSPSSRLNFSPSNNGHEKRACALASSSSRIVRSPLAPPLERSNETTPGVRESPAIRLGQVHVQRGQTHV